MTRTNSPTTSRRPMAAMTAITLAIGALLAGPTGFTPPAHAQSALDQLYDAAGGNRDHEFDGSPHNDNWGPADTPSVPDPGAGEPVSSD